MEKELYTKIYQIEKTHWWYVARRDIIFDWISRVLGQKKDSLILDIGCGTGFNIEYLKDQGFNNVYGIDSANEALIFCRERELKQVVNGDVIALPFANHSFDLICALDIIEHVENDLLGLRETGRLLKPGGTLIIFTPAFQFLWSLQDEVSHHFRRYTAGELEKKVHSAGLYIKKLSYANTFLFPIIWIGRLLLRFVRKQVDLISEADLNPKWSNGPLKFIFDAEKGPLRYINFPFGVSILCVCYRPDGN